MAIKYNESQRSNSSNEYLDELHNRFKCCIISGLNLTINDVIESNHSFKLPNSCCQKLDEYNECNELNAYSTKCDEIFNKELRTYKMVIILILVFSIATSTVLLAIIATYYKLLFFYLNLNPI